MTALGVGLLTLIGAGILVARPSFAPGVLTFVACLEFAVVDVAGAGLRAVHLIAIIYLADAYIVRRTDPPRIAGISVRTLLVYASLVVGALLVPILVHHDKERIFALGLVLLNLLTLWAVLGSVRLFANENMTWQVVDAAFASVVLIAAMQSLAVVLGWREPFPFSRLVDFGRAPGSFEEATWMGAVAAVAALYFAARKRPILLTLSVVVTLLSASRAGIGVLVFGALISLLWRKPLLRPATVAAMGAIMAIAILVTPTFALLKPPPPQSIDSVDTRRLDQEAVLKDKSAADWVLGADDVVVVDPSRSRVLPLTSQNVVLDHVQREGVWGLVLLGVTGVIVLRPIRPGAPPWMNPFTVAIFLLLAFSVLNNCTGRPWFWAIAGLGLGAYPRPRLDKAGPDRSSVAGMAQSAT